MPSDLDHSWAKSFITLYQNAPYPRILADAELKVIWHNEAAARLYPYIILPDSLQMALSGYHIPDLIAALKRGESLQLPVAFIPFEGIELNLLPFVEQEDKLKGAVVVLPEKVPTQHDHFTDTERMISAFSNEFRSPLSIIFSVLNPLSKKLAGDPSSQQLLQSISASCYRMLRATVNITEAFRFSGANVTSSMVLSNEDITAFTKELCEGIKGMFAHKKEIAFDYTLPARPVFTCFDVNHLAIALLNLVLNAAQFKKTGTVHIHLSMKIGEKEVFFRVQDDGAGIQKKYLPQVFKPYFSVHPNGQPFAGAGLGLTLVRNIVTAHKGSVTIFSQQDVGTTVGFSIPIVEDNTLPSVLSSPHIPINDRFSPLIVQLSGICDVYPL